MAKPTFANVEAFLASLPPDRREAVSTVRAAINRALPKGYAEGISYGMLGWYVPHSEFPAGYHCDPKQPLPFACLASQKGFMSLHLMCVYWNPAVLKQFQADWAKSGKRLDMGQACVRFKTLDALDLPTVTKTIASIPVDAYVRRYLAALADRAPAKKGKPVAAKAKAGAKAKPATKRKA